ncbi:V-type proton ATPase subunit G-like [Oscarella lobularis]|uniref:V-type proton ATPase subunit G-like n=1 Tax=Oscarella lobularis TaxID=121494 RepID=UPI0033138E63
MASHSTQVQQLLAAEKKAAEIVSEARRKKTKRLKQAKEEAAREIEAYRKEREDAYQKQKQQHMGSKDTFDAKVRADTEQKLREAQADVEANKEQVITRVLGLVQDVKPEIHKNLRV